MESDQILAPSEIPFNLEFPIEVWQKAGEPGKERRIGGYISSEHRDKQNEIVLQRGLDFDDFIKNGWLNDNHSKETTGIVGYPEKVSRTVYKGKPATYLEGFLIPGYAKADEIWRLANSLQKTKRRLGFSIEGKVKRRAGADGKTIAQAHVTNVAITNCPVNTTTGLEVLAKSLISVEKALEAGQAVTLPSAPVAGDGFALRTESLETSPKNALKTKKKKKKKKKKQLSKAEALDFIIERHPTLSLRAAERILAFATNKGA